MHALKKFCGTLGICARIIMARTFGKYIHSGWDGRMAFCLYRWRGHDYYIQTEPAMMREQKPLGTRTRSTEWMP
jgi:hypothetical protein